MIHCVPVSDSYLLSELEGSKDILLLGCSLCANISYCIEKSIDMPMYNWLLNPAALKNEIQRIAVILEDKNYDIDSLVLLSLCFIRNNDKEKLLKKSKNNDTIITFSCEYGNKNISDIVAKDKKIICAMKAKGFMRAEVEKKGLSIVVDKDKLYINNKAYSEYKDTDDR